MQFLNDGQLRTNFEVTAEWNKGFTGKLDLTNLGDDLIDGIVEFESQFEIDPGEIWGGEIVSREGNVYTLKVTDDKGSIDSQESASIFFNANKINNEVTAPQSIKLGSESILDSGVAESGSVEISSDTDNNTDTVESAMPLASSTIDTVTPDVKTPVSESVESETAANNSLAADVDFSLVQDWGSGFQGAISITNETGGNIDSWSLEFDFPNEITDIWDAEIEQNQGGSYVISNTDWNREIKAGETLTFGFTGNDSVSVEPQNFELEGSSFNSPSTGDSIYTYENDALTPEFDLNQPYQGRATFFDAANPAGGLGNSGFDIPAPDRLQQVVAINNIQWNSSEASGAFLEVSGPKQRDGAAPIIVQVTDQLVERADGMDMSAQAFELVADPVAGVVNIDYQLVGPDDNYVTAYGHKIGDGIVVEGIADSKPYYPTFRLNNHRYPVESVELLEADGDLVELDRGSDNRFVFEETSAIYEPQDLVVTDIFGQQVTLNDVNITNGSDADTVTGEQFAMM